jgi:hypothetical protein
MAKKDEIEDLEAKNNNLPPISKKKVTKKRPSELKLIKLPEPKRPVLKSRVQPTSRVQPASRSPPTDNVQKVLVDNFVNLQKVMTNLAMKFDDLSLNINKLLQLFEISAKNFAEKYSEGGIPAGGVDKEFLDKIDNLLDQNKTIARGIMLIEEKIRIKDPQNNSTFVPSQPANPRPTNPRPAPQQGTETRFRNMVRSRPLPRY